MSGEMWVVIGVFALVAATMVARPETFAFWRIHRRPEVLAASRSVGALLLVAIAVGVFLRCAEPALPAEPPEQSFDPPPATSAPRQSETQPLGVDQAPIEIVATGAPPHRRLAYQPRAVDRVAALSWAMRMGGSEPQMRIALRLAWRSGSAPSTYQFSVSQASIDVPTPAVGGEAAAFETLERGFEKVAGDAKMVAPHQLVFEQTEGRDTTPSVPMLLHLLAVPLPAGAVGVGARWGVTEPLRKPDAEGKASRSFHLVALDEAGARVEVEYESAWTAAGEGPSSKGTSRFDGQVEVRFDDVLPHSAKGTFRESLEVPLQPGDGTAVDSTVEIELVSPPR